MPLASTAIPLADSVLSVGLKSLPDDLPALESRELTVVFRNMIRAWAESVLTDPRYDSAGADTPSGSVVDLVEAVNLLCGETK